MISLEDYISKNNCKNIKLHLGCGGVKWKDFINVDLYAFDHKISDTSRSGCAADAFADIRDLKLVDNSIDEIFSSHVFEHFTRWQADDMLASWFRILKPGGLVVIETPDFWRCVLWLFHPMRQKRRLGKAQFYGNQWDRLEYETHRYLWSSGEIVEACKHAGFRDIFLTHRTETHHPGRDMRIEATK
jgi:predicted SAM-dependent methyltransferase